MNIYLTFFAVFSIERSSEDEVVSLEDVYIPYTFFEELLDDVDREDDDEVRTKEGESVQGNMVFIGVDRNEHVDGEVEV